MSTAAAAAEAAAPAMVPDIFHNWSNAPIAGLPNFGVGVRGDYWQHAISRHEGPRISFL